MTHDELVAWRNRLLLGDPPYEKDSLGAFVRKSGMAGLHERRHGGLYDVNASGVLMAMEASLALCQHAIDLLPRAEDE